MNGIAAIGFLFTAITGIFVIVNPLTTAFVFVSLLPRAGRAERQVVAWRAVKIATGIMLTFALLGGLLFQLFGITVEAFRIAGGLILFGIAMNMIRPRSGGDAGGKQVGGEGVGDDVAVIPLAIPFISGPGCIATIMILTHQAQNMIESAMVLVAILMIAAACYFAMVHSDYIVRLLGDTGREVGSKLFGIILAVIAVQFVITGTVQVLYNHGLIDPAQLPGTGTQLIDPADPEF